MLRQGFWRLAALVAVATLAGCDSGPEIVAAKWASRPSASDLAMAYPAFARMARIPGRVKVRCTYELDGVLRGCRLLGVAPAGLHFEDTLPRLLAKYVVTPQTLGGRPAPAPITFVVAFDPPPAPPAFAGPPVTAAERAAAGRTVAVFSRFEGQMTQDQASRSVDLDRMSAVAAIVDRAYAADGKAVRDAMPTALVQAMTPADRRALGRGGMYWPGQGRLEMVSPEYHAAQGRVAARMRAEYCAAYSCDATLPNETAKKR